jgi:hypothetical protein
MANKVLGSIVNYLMVNNTLLAIIIAAKEHFIGEE